MKTAQRRWQKRCCMRRESVRMSCDSFLIKGGGRTHILELGKSFTSKWYFHFVIIDRRRNNKNDAKGNPNVLSLLLAAEACAPWIYNAISSWFACMRFFGRYHITNKLLDTQYCYLTIFRFIFSLFVVSKYDFGMVFIAVRLALSRLTDCCFFFQYLKTEMRRMNIACNTDEICDEKWILL